jgi:lipopolysaccharide/colanic/teichoic acid biosynthesis glycosyltransferase
MGKRIFDLVVSGSLLVIAAPLLMLIAIAIKLDSPGPVLFRQRRVGRYGKPFQIFKFRSMVTNAAAVGPFYTTANDTRITRVGRLLRKSSLDELPQLINVFRGEMSIVGPRPNVYEQRDQYTAEQWDLRNSICPGITGLAQATKRSLATVEERNSLDLQYVSNESLSSDLGIILRTVRQMLTVGGN